MDKDSSSSPTHPEPAASVRDVFATWVPSLKERNDMIDVAAYYIAQRSGFNCDPNECWDAGAAQVDRIFNAFIRDITERMPQQDSLEQQVRERTALLRAMAVELTMADEMQRSFGLRINVRDDGLPKPLDEIGLKAVFRATRELLINVAKHAQVSMAEVEATREEDHLVLSVADSGVGFDASKNSGPSTQHGYGLFSVRERIDFMGGKVQIDSNPGNGTVVVMTMPLAASRSPY